MKKYIFIISSIFLFYACTPMQYNTRNSFQGSNNNTSDAISHHYSTRTMVRVLIKKVVSTVSIASRGLMDVKDKNLKIVLFRGSKKKVHFDIKNIHSDIVVTSNNQLVEVDGKSYRGAIELLKRGNLLFIINSVPLEKYLFSVVPSEIPANWHMDALKAQAIAARTYAFYHLNKKRNKSIYDLDATTKFQVYKGSSIENNRTNQAVLETAGEILTYKGRAILAYFHSTCGGRTIDDKYVWKEHDLIYLKGVHSNFCKNSPHWHWKEIISLKEIERYVRRKYDKVDNIYGIQFQRNRGRITDVKILHRNGILIMTGNNFRLLFPSKKMKSTYFKITKKNNALVIEGKGWRHGVGLCQWSAKGMAEAGINYRTILHYFYKDISFGRLSTSNYVANK